MFAGKQDYLTIAKIQCKALKIVYNSNESYEELLLNNNEVSIIKSSYAYWLLRFLKAQQI